MRTCGAAGFVATGCLTWSTRWPVSMTALRPNAAPRVHAHVGLSGPADSRRYQRGAEPRRTLGVAGLQPRPFAVRPKQKPPQPDPLSAADAARLLDAAFDLDDDWGTLVWLVMTTGVRRGEICALR